MKKDFSYGIIPIQKRGKTFLFLLIKQTKGHWGFPKGHQNRGETALQTAIRECREETGLSDISLDTKKEFREAYVFKNYADVIYKEVIYFIGYTNTQHIEIQPDEIAQAKWFSYPQARATLSFKEVQDILDEVYIYLSK